MPPAKHRRGVETDKMKEEADDSSDATRRTNESSASSPPKKKRATAGGRNKCDTEELHCMRCHESFHAEGEGGCIVEHDFDDFEGSRNGTSHYTGTLGCCGAHHRFHRHYGDERTDPEHCFDGRHTSDPDDVEYNGKTIRACTADKCGEALRARAVAAARRQREAKERAEERRTSEAEAHRKRRVEEAPEHLRRREERGARAGRLGLDWDEDELNSDVDEDGCEEFDYASDSSLAPPFSNNYIYDRL